VDGADVRFLGFVPDAELPALYATAAVAAYPSHGEGFGMPILEAMVQGTPVVTSAGGATEEVADGAAVLADPLDPGSIATALRTALDDPAPWAAAGRARVVRSTWTAAAAATAAVYREVAR
jgi:glycosyltransferase involved in cell wall biosynthesis